MFESDQSYTTANQCLLIKKHVYNLLTSSSSTETAYMDLFMFFLLCMNSKDVYLMLFLPRCNPANC